MTYQCQSKQSASDESVVRLVPHATSIQEKEALELSKLLGSKGKIDKFVLKMSRGTSLPTRSRDYRRCAISSGSVHRELHYLRTDALTAPLNLPRG